MRLSSPMVYAKHQLCETPKSDGPCAVTNVRCCGTLKPGGFKIDSKIKKGKFEVIYFILTDPLELITYRFVHH